MLLVILNQHMGKFWAHNTILTIITFFIIEVSVPSQESERSCICVLRVSISPYFLSNFLLIVWNCFDRAVFCIFFILLTINAITHIQSTDWGRSFGTIIPLYTRHILLLSVPGQWAVTCVRGIHFASFSYFLLDLGTVPSVWYFCFSFHWH